MRSPTFLRPRWGHGFSVQENIPPHSLQPAQQDFLVLPEITSMPHSKNNERRVENDDHLKKVLKSQGPRVVPQKGDDSIKPEEDRQHETQVFSDHPHFLGFAVVVADPQIIQCPEQREQQGNNRKNSRGAEEMP